MLTVGDFLQFPHIAWHIRITITASDALAPGLYMYTLGLADRLPHLASHKLCMRFRLNKFSMIVNRLRTV